MASEKLIKELNDQYNFEMASGYVYLGMAAYCKAENMNGFAHFFSQQAKEEYEHAMKFYDFLYDIDARANLQAIPEPKNEYDSFLAAFEEALHHEKMVTSKIYDLLDSAKAENDYPTIEFLQWFVKEQVEEEDTMRSIIAVLKGIDGKFTGLYLYDKELGKR